MNCMKLDGGGIALKGSDGMLVPHHQDLLKAETMNRCFNIDQAGPSW
jgi:hypothetical protein